MHHANMSHTSPPVDAPRLEFRNTEKIAARDILAIAVLLYATPKTRGIMPTRYRTAPLAVTFSSLLDCSEPDLKIVEMHDRSHYA